MKDNAIEFTKKNQSVTYLVLSNEDGMIVGYFTIALKPITVNANRMSNTVKRKLQLKIILSDAPSVQNCMKYAILFKRGYGSIEQIYRWSTTQNQDLSERRKEDSFIQQIKRVAKELGLRG